MTEQSKAEARMGLTGQPSGQEGRSTLAGGQLPAQLLAGTAGDLDEALKHEKTFSDSIINSIPGVFYVLDRQGRLLRWNQALEELTGLSRDQLLGADALRPVCEEDRALVAARIRAAFDAGHSEVEARLKSKAGRRHFLLRGRRMDVGRDSYLVGSGVDITERRQAEEALREARDALETRVVKRTAELQESNRVLHERENELAAIYEHAPIIMMLVDDQCRVSKVNTREGTIAGDRSGDLVTLGPGAVLRCANALKNPDGCGFGTACGNCVIRRTVLGALATGRDYRQVEGGITVAVQGREQTLTFLVSACKLSVRERPHVLVTLEDITLRKQAEDALRKRERELEGFFAEAPLGLLWVGPDGSILRVNQTELELLGRASSEVVDQPVCDFHVEPEVARDVLERLAKKETVQNHRARVRQKSGTLKHVLIDANGFWEKDRLLYSHWFVRDITRRVELEQELLATSEREQRRLGQDLHDDLCQQLAGIEFLSQTLARDLGAKSVSEAGQAKEIAQSVQHAMSQTRELARGLSPVGIEAEGLMEALRQLAGRTSKVFRLDCGFRCATPVLVPDPEVATHLYRIAQEAVGNAVRHAKAGHIDIVLAAEETNVRLTVSDDGIGIPRELPKLEGMGLRIMRYRASVIGGSLAVKRNRGKGTTVVCTIADGQAAAETRNSK